MSISLTEAHEIVFEQPWEVVKHLGGDAWGVVARVPIMGISVTVVETHSAHDQDMMERIVADHNAALS